jgi:hypothetical protein
MSKYTIDRYDLSNWKIREDPNAPTQVLYDDRETTGYTYTRTHPDDPSIVVIACEQFSSDWGAWGLVTLKSVDGDPVPQIQIDEGYECWQDAAIAWEVNHINAPEYLEADRLRAEREKATEQKIGDWTCTEHFDGRAWHDGPSVEYRRDAVDGSGAIFTITNPLSPSSWIWQMEVPGYPAISDNGSFNRWQDAAETCLKTTEYRITEPIRNWIARWDSSK